eukprot:768790-Hanusia_phi.AAC.5
MGITASCCETCTGEGRRKENILIHDVEAPAATAFRSNSESDEKPKRRSLDLRPGINVDKAYEKIREDYQRNRKAFQRLYPIESQIEVRKSHGLDDENQHELMRIKRHLQAGRIYQLTHSRDIADSEDGKSKPADWVLCMKRGSLSGSSGGVYAADVRQIHNFSKGTQFHRTVENSKGLDQVGVARMKLSAKDEELVDLSRRQLYKRKHEDRLKNIAKDDPLAVTY